MGRGRWSALMVGAGVMVLSAVAAAAAPLAVSGPLHFTAVGDISENINARTLISAVAAADSDLTFALGDLSYGVTGQEQAWCDMVKARVGEGFPFELIAGNHESDGQNGNINDFSACLPNQLPGVKGTYGREYYVDVPQAEPLVRFIMISPGLTYPDGAWSYAAGSPRYNWTANAIDTARSANIPWVVVGMHKPCISIGAYPCDPGTAITNLMLDRKIDLVLHGHEHLYQRSKQLALGPGCTSLAIASYDADCVKASGSSMVAGAGTVFATVGTGGVSLRDVNLSDPEAPYFDAASGLNANPTYGFLDLNADTESMSASFVRSGGGTFADTFTLTKGAVPANQAPTAAFTHDPQGLTVTYDASDSMDPDGTISSYAWDFGDGQSGIGINPQHTYPSAGTYVVTLTVTDSGGATDTASSSITVTAPPVPTGLASDSFERTVATGWGSADLGGPWATTGSAAASGVSAGQGRLSMLSAGTGPQAFLNGVSTTNLDLRMLFSLDKRPAGGSAGVDQGFLLRRVTGSGDYRARLRVTPTGAVRLGLFRVAGNGAQTSLTDTAVTGLTYNANDVLALRAQATGTSPTTLRARVWREGTVEPAGWTVTAGDSTAAFQAPGAIGLHSYLSSAATNAPIAARFDQVAATTP